jgi:hypothetical protein
VKLAQQAGKAAPVVAVIGALASAPHAYDDLMTGTGYPAEHHSAALQAHRPAFPAQPPRPVGTGDRLSNPDSQLGNAGAGQLALAKSRTYQPRHTTAAGTGSAPDAKPSHGARHHQGSGDTRRHATRRCSGSGGMLPANYTEIVTFLTAHGYTGNAAAGIAGNIYQESGGNPESIGSVGGGLIGWTPLPGGFVTGNPAADLQTQLAAILTYNQGWAQYLPTLNAAGSPAQAADIYVTDFERAGIPAASNREASANAVAAGCGF